ncbi:hypothetical protein ABZ554_16710 [Streptomyces sp. NPDC020125]|uniref:hypothetical protein n=1 Tax=Streptomyces sp. NPDC020125 TaxID=3154593 RepID=UPI0033CC54BF
MDPISMALLVALAGGAGGEFGRQTWARLSALVTSPHPLPDTPGTGAPPPQG